MLGLVIVVPAYAGALVYFGFSPEATDVGYQPEQPILYSHKVHVGQLGMDCRYCHTTVQQAAQASIPPTATCINCHSRKYGILRETSPKIALLQERFYGSERFPRGSPMPWIRVHDLPGYVYFNHSAHTTRGVRCVTCHGRVDRMDEVYQAKPLSMSWCLECHRNPGPNLVPKDRLDTLLTDMTWAPPTDTNMEEYAQLRVAEYNIRNVDYLQSCSVCHR